MYERHCPDPGLERETFECLRSRSWWHKELILSKIRGEGGFYSQPQYEAGGFHGAGGPPAHRITGTGGTLPTATVAVMPGSRSRLKSSARPSGDLGDQQPPASGGAGGQNRSDKVETAGSTWLQTRYPHGHPGVLTQERSSFRTGTGGWEILRASCWKRELAESGSSGDFPPRRPRWGGVIAKREEFALTTKDHRITPTTVAPQISAWSRSWRGTR